MTPVKVKVKFDHNVCIGGGGKGNKAAATEPVIPLEPNGSDGQSKHMFTSKPAGGCWRPADTNDIMSLETIASWCSLKSRVWASAVARCCTQEQPQQRDQGPARGWRSPGGAERSAPVLGYRCSWQSRETSGFFFFRFHRCVSVHLAGEDGSMPGSGP